MKYYFYFFLISTKVLFVVSFCVCAIQAQFSQVVKNSQNIDINLLFVDLDKDNFLYDVQYKLETIIQELDVCNTNDIEHCIQSCEELILNMIFSEGYFDAVIDSQWNENLTQLTFVIKTNTRYKISEYTISGNADIQISNWNLDIKNQYVTPHVINKATNQIFDLIDKNCSFLNIDIKHESIVNYKNKTLNIEFQYFVSNPTYIKDVKITGTNTISESEILNIIGFTPNQPFHHFTIDQFVHKINSLNLFSSIVPILPSKVDQDGSISIQIDTKEKKRKRFYSAFNYNVSNQKFDVTFGYVFNNMRLIRENLDISAQFYSINFPIIYASYHLPFVKNLEFLIKTRLGSTYYNNFILNNNEIAIGLNSFSHNKQLEMLLLSKYIFSKESLNTSSKINQNKVHLQSLEKKFSHIELSSQFSYFNNQKILERMLFECKVFINCDKINQSFVKTYFLINFFNKIKNNICKTNISFVKIFKNQNTDLPISQFILLGDDAYARGYNNVINKKETKLSGIRQHKDNIYAINLSLDFIMPNSSKNFDFGLFYDLTYIGQSYKVQHKNFYNTFGLSTIYKQLSVPLKIELAVPLNTRYEIDPVISFALGILF